MTAPPVGGAVVLQSVSTSSLKPTVHVGDLHAIVALQVFPQPADEYIEAAAQKVGVITPHHVQHQFTGQHLVAVHAQQPQHLGLLARQFALLLRVRKHQVPVVERVVAQFEGLPVAFILTLPTGAAQDGLDAQQQFLVAEGLWSCSHHPGLESGDAVLGHALCGKTIGTWAFTVRMSSARLNLSLFGNITSRMHRS